MSAEQHWPRTAGVPATAVAGPPALTVGQYASRISGALGRVGAAVVEGEVVDEARLASGMLWFAVTDGDAALPCKVFGRDLRRLAHRPRKGDAVRLDVDRPDLFARNGKLDLIVSGVRLTGAGELLARRQALLQRLTAEGLCDPSRRRALPQWPRAVGLVAGAKTNGMADVTRALHDRWPATRIVLAAATVQGVRAPASVIDALARLQDHPDVDVIIVARGGGSPAELACFDDERLCRAVFACETPVICAVGHVGDVPVCSHVAHDAVTPSRSVELAVPSAREVAGRIGAAGRALGRAGVRLDGLRDRAARVDPSSAVALARHAGRLAAVDLDATAALDRRAGRLAAVHLGPRPALERRAVQVARQDVAVDRALDAARQAVAGAVRELNEARNAVDGRLDRRIAAAAAGLDAVPHRGRATREGQQKAVDAAGRALADGVAGRLDGRAAHLAGTAARLADGVRAAQARRSADTAATTRRLVDQARDGLLRATADRRAAVDLHAAQLTDRAHRRLADAALAARHAGQLVAAQDLRRRGWLLASSAGQPVRAAADLHPGQLLDLRFHDGQVTATVGGTPDTHHTKEHRP